MYIGFIMICFFSCLPAIKMLQPSTLRVVSGRILDLIGTIIDIIGVNRKQLGKCVYRSAAQL